MWSIPIHPFVVLYLLPRAYPFVWAVASLVLHCFVSLPLLSAVVSVNCCSALRDQKTMPIRPSKYFLLVCSPGHSYLPIPASPCWALIRFIALKVFHSTNWRARVLSDVLPLPLPFWAWIPIFGPLIVSIPFASFLNFTKSMPLLDHPLFRSCAIGSLNLISSFSARCPRAFPLFSWASPWSRPLCPWIVHFRCLTSSLVVFPFSLLRCSGPENHASPARIYCIPVFTLQSGP